MKPLMLPLLSALIFGVANVGETDAAEVSKAMARAPIESSDSSLGAR